MDLLVTKVKFQRSFNISNPRKPKVSRAVAIERYRCDIFKPIGEQLGYVTFGRDIGSQEWYVIEVDGWVPVDEKDCVKRVKRILEARQYQWKWVPLPTFYPSA